MKILNGQLIEETSEDTTIKEQTIADGIVEKNAELEKEKKAKSNAEAKATAQASGNTKLLGLGLSQEEATSLTGYTPPEEE